MTALVVKLAWAFVGGMIGSFIVHIVLDIIRSRRYR